MQLFKHKAGRAGLRLLAVGVFAIGVLAEILEAISTITLNLADDAYKWAQAKLRGPVPPRVVKIPVRQLGLATGQQVFVRVIKPRKIEVTYVRGE